MVTDEKQSWIIGYSLFYNSCTTELDVVNFDKKYSEAAVMNVVYESYYTNKEKNKNYSQDEFKIFIYLVNKEVIEIDGDEGVGNGEYGSGFWVTVTR